MASARSPLAEHMIWVRFATSRAPTDGPFAAAIHGLRDRWMRSCSVARWSCHMNPAADSLGAGSDALFPQVEAGTETAAGTSHHDRSQIRVQIDSRDDPSELRDHR